MSAFPGPARSLLGPLALCTNVSDGGARRAKTPRIRGRNDGNITARPHSAPNRGARFGPFSLVSALVGPSRLPIANRRPPTAPVSNGAQPTLPQPDRGG